MHDLRLKNVQFKQSLVRRALSAERASLASIVGFLVICVVIFTIIAPSFASVGNLVTIVRQNAAALVAATAMTLVITTGGIDLSVGAVAAFSGVVLSVVAVPLGLPPVIAIMAVLVTGAFAGFVNAWLITVIGIAPFIVTLSTMAVFRGLALLVAQGYSLPLPENAVLLTWLGRGWLGPLPVAALIAVIAVGVGHVVLRKMRFGRHVIGIGANAEGVRRSGVNIRFITCGVYILSGVAASVAGLIMAGRLGSAASNVAGGFEFEVIAAVVLGGTSLNGGRGSVIGSALGVLTLACLKNGLILAHISPFYTQIATGLITIAAIWFNLTLGRRAAMLNR